MRIGVTVRAALAVAATMSTISLVSAQALPKPDVGPEKPFAPPPRVERTLGNGLRVIAVRYGSVSPQVLLATTVDLRFQDQAVLRDEPPREGATQEAGPRSVAAPSGGRRSG